MNDEYIRKQDAIDLINKISNLDLKAKGGICVSLANLEKADVVQVVRCKDCKSRRTDGYCTKFQNNISGIAVSWFMPEDDGFCSYGERKGE